MKPAVTGSAPASTARMASQLSPRQREILDLVAEGRTSKEIAVELGISESTVKWHLANAFERLGASSRAEAVARAIRSNGAVVVTEPTARVRPGAQARVAWPRLVAIAIAIAIAGALLGGATLATLRLGPAPLESPTTPPANGPDGNPIPSPPPIADRTSASLPTASAPSQPPLSMPPPTSVLPSPPLTLPLSPH
jgi:DNA-binding CsgD family transcriptional regulator